MSDSKHIDELVKTYLGQLQRAEELGKSIEEQATPTAVLFIDLADSTPMKSSMSARSWLGHIFTFISAISELAKNGSGTVVKRIGDEVMLTFDTTASSEQFLDSLAESKLHERFQFKIAADYGKAYHFQFERHLADDPYGTVVDRCARIAKYCKPGVTLCSGQYVREVGNESFFYPLGSFSLKGLPDPEPIFVRKPQPSPPSEEYLEPLLAALNAPANRWTGFRFATRTYTPASFSLITKNVVARPFLLRELLTLPRLPYSFQEFCMMIKDLDDDSRNQYLGYCVEWEASFDSFTRQGSFLIAYLSEESLPLVHLSLVSDMIEIVQKIKKRTRVKFGGVIMKLGRLGFDLDYVEIVGLTPAWTEARDRELT
jgi:class 3 adenylate cyclase